MIAYLGTGTILESIQKNFRTASSFVMKKLEEAGELNNHEAVELVVIGPNENRPVKLVQEIVNRDKYLSVILFAFPDKLSQLKSRIQYSPFVGKNTACIAYQQGKDCSDIFQSAIMRTRQKREFSKIQLTKVSKLAYIPSISMKLQNMGYMLDHAPVGAILADKSGQIVSANQRARNLFPALDKSPVNLNQLFKENHHAELGQLLTSQSDAIHEWQDNQDRHYEVSTSIVRENDDDNTLLLINDVTERMAKNNRFIAILESLPHIAWTANPNGELDYFSQEWSKYTNLPIENSIGNAWQSTIHPNELRGTLMIWNQSINQTKTFSHVFRLRRYDNEFRWHSVKAVPVFSANGEVLMWVGTSIDIHDQVLQSAVLERKVKERTKLLEESNAELEQFTYISSHDLQEPLRKIRTFASMIRESSAQSLDLDSQRYLDKVISTATRMSTLLKDLLTFTRLHSQEKITEVDLKEIITACQEDLELAITQNKATLHIANLPKIEGRSIQLKQLFYNLISNAVKFRKLNEDPVISITAEKLQKEMVNTYGMIDNAVDYWNFVVKDNGIGFDQKYADQIFTLFQQLHGRSVYDGTGIGLAICKKIVNNHNGKIFALSSGLNGSEFHVILPQKLLI